MHSKLETYSPKLVAHRTRQSEPDNRLNMHRPLGDTIHRAHGHAYLSHMLFSSLGHGGRGWVVGPPPALRRHRRHLELGHRVLHPLRRTADDGGAHLQPCAGRRGLLRTPHRQHKKVSVVVVAEEEEEEEEKEGGREEEGTLEATRISRAACPDSFAMSTPMILRTGSSSIARSTVVRTHTRSSESVGARAGWEGWSARCTDRRVRLEVLEVLLHVVDEMGRGHARRHCHGRGCLARDGDGLAIDVGRGDLTPRDARLAHGERRLTAADVEEERARHRAPLQRLHAALPWHVGHAFEDRPLARALAFFFVFRVLRS